MGVDILEIEPANEASQAILVGAACEHSLRVALFNEAPRRVLLSKVRELGGGMCSIWPRYYK